MRNTFQLPDNQFPPPDLIETKAAFAEELRMFLAEFGILDSYISVNVNRQSFTSVQFDADFPVVLNVSEKYHKSNLFPSTFTVAGHSPMSIAAWLCILRKTIIQIEKYPFYQEYSVFTSSPATPTLVVEVFKESGVPVSHACRLRDIAWPIEISRTTCAIAEQVTLPPLNPFKKWPTERTINNRARTCLLAIQGSAAWRLIRSGSFIAKRFNVYTNVGW